ncbi:Aldehyde dehydrogenase (plasmid) [Escherichia coli]|nr:Aldehyde dehydrogenase [Escherichia coli]
MPAFEWVHVQLHQQKGMISLSPPTICNSAGHLHLCRIAAHRRQTLSGGQCTGDNPAANILHKHLCACHGGSWSAAADNCMAIITHTV